MASMVSQTIGPDDARTADIQEIRPRPATTQPTMPTNATAITITSNDEPLQLPNL
jgi:hypothetical protein